MGRLVLYRMGKFIDYIEAAGNQSRACAWLKNTLFDPALPRKEGL
jgi:hypothetical protein